MMDELAKQLRELVEQYLEEQKKNHPERAVKGEFTQGKLAKELGLDPGTVSKYLKGRLLPSTTFSKKLIRHIYGKDSAAVARIERELDGLKRVQSKAPSLEFSEYNPSAVAVDFPPFLQVSGALLDKGFVYMIFKRLFDLANRPIDDRDIDQGSLSAALNDVSNPQNRHNLVLGVAETIPRSIVIHTFHTPATITINVVAPLHGLEKPSEKQSFTAMKNDLDDIRAAFLEQSIKDKFSEVKFLVVNKEFGHTHLLEILKVP